MYNDTWNGVVRDFKKYNFDKYLIPALISFARYGIDGKLTIDYSEISIRELIFQHFLESSDYNQPLAENKMNAFLSELNKKETAVC